MAHGYPEKVLIYHSWTRWCLGGTWRKRQWRLVHSSNVRCTLAKEELASVLERGRRDTLSRWNPPGSPVDESEANTEVKLHFPHYNSG